MNDDDAKLVARHAAYSLMGSSGVTGCVVIVMTDDGCHVVTRRMSAEGTMKAAASLLTGWLDTP